MFLTAGEGVLPLKDSKQAIQQAEALVVIPTYNERDNIQTLIRELVALPVPITVLVVDDNSPDGTGKLVEQLGEAFPNVKVLHRAGKQGIGSAYLAGFRYGIENGYPFIMTMDADFSHDPKRVPALIVATDHADVVIGSRYCNGGAIRQWPVSRRILSRGANGLARALLGLHSNDCTGGFRCYRRSVLESIQLDKIQSQGYSCLVELLFACERNGCRVAEVPIVFVDRQFGKTKISQKEVYKGMWTLLRLGFKRWF